MTPILILIQPFDLEAGQRVNIRIGDAAEADAYGLGGVQWIPAVSQRPVLSLELMSPDIDGKVIPGRARVSINLAALEGLPQMLKWAGAPVAIYTPKDLAWPVTPEFDGYVTDRSIDLENKEISLTMEVSTTFMGGPLLTGEFTGGGGILGDADKRGTLWPAGFGAQENMEPVWFDNTRWIGMIDGYGNTQAITRLMEGLSDFGPRVADYANYAALAAAIDAKAIAPGQWGTCVAQGLVGLGAPPVGPITVNATFGSNRVGAMIRRILDVHRGVAIGNIDVAAFDALDAAVPRPVHYWTSSQRDTKDLIEALAASANATPLVTFQKKVTITRAVTTAAIATLDRSGGQEPRVVDWKSAGAQLPVWRLRARTARPGTVLSYDQVNYKDTIEDKGLYDAEETYRAGMVVWSADKSSWLYINDLPGSGIAPPAWPTTSNAYWQNLTPPVSAVDVRYNDGTPIEDLKPAQIGANVTGTNTAAGIYGQGTLATQNDVTYGTQISGLPTAIMPGNIFGGGKIDATQVLYSNGGPTVVSLKPAEANANVTETRTAAAITGQGAWATLTDPAATPLKLAGMSDSDMMTDDMSYASAAAFSALWANPGGGAGEISIGSDAGAPGGKYVRIGNNAGNDGFWGHRREPMPFDPNALYEVLFVVRQVAGVGLFYAGLAGFADDKTTLVNAVGSASITTQHYVVASNLAIGSGWTILRGFVKGFSAGSGSTTPFTDPASPGVMHPNVRYIAPMMVPNAVGAAGTFDIAFARVRRIDPVRLSSMVLRADGSTILTDAAAVTALGTAAAISGQAAWATYTGLVPANVAGQVSALDTSGNLSALSKVTDRKLTFLFRADGTTALTEAATITALGTAAAIVGQGSLATASAVNLATEVTGTLPVGSAAAGLQNANVTIAANGALTGAGGGQVTFGGLGGGAVGLQSEVYFGQATLRETTGGTVATLSAFKTASGTAAGIAGQGALATLNLVGSGQLATGAVGATQLATGAINSGHMAYIDNLNIIMDPDFRVSGAWSTTAVGAGSGLNTTDAIVTGTGAGQMGVRAAYKAVHNGAVSEPSRWVFIQGVGANMPPIEPGNYLASVKVGVTAGYNGVVDLYLYWFDETGLVFISGTAATLIDYRTVPAAADTVTDHQVKLTIPAGARRIRFGLYSTPKVGVASAGTVYGAKPKMLKEVTQAFLSTTAVRLGTNIVRADGSTSLTDSAAVTSLGTAAAIAGQAAWATYSGLVPANVAGQVSALDTSGNLSALSKVTDRKLTMLFRADGTTAVTEAATITALGTASAISGQSAWATYSGLVPANVAGQVSALDTSGNLSGLAKVTDRKLTLLFRADGSTAVTEAAVVTALGTASAVVGQGALATLSSVAWGTHLTGRPAELTDGRVAAALDASGDLARNITSTRRDASDLLGRTGGGVFTGELAADVTSGKTAAAVAGQGPWATYSTTSPTKLEGVETGADVTSMIIGPSEIIIECDPGGTPTAALLPKIVPFKLNRNGADVTTSTAWTVSVISGTSSSTIGAANGLLSTTDLSTVESIIRIQGVYAGTTRVLDVKLSKNLATAPPPVGTATMDFDGALTAINQSTMMACSRDLVITTGSNGEAILTAPLEFIVNTGATGGAFGMFLIWQRWNGSAWVDISTETAQISLAYRYYEPPDYYSDPGYITCNQTVTGLGAGTSQTFRLRGRTDTGTRARQLTGEAKAQGN